MNSFLTIPDLVLEPLAQEDNRKPKVRKFLAIKSRQGAPSKDPSSKPPQHTILTHWRASSTARHPEVEPGIKHFFCAH
jgi:hypothetical protein